MKHQAKSRNPDPPQREPLHSKSFDNGQRRRLSNSQNPRDTIDPNDSINKYKKPSLPKKFVNFMQKASVKNQEGKNHLNESKNWRPSEMLPERHDSVESDSERGCDRSEDGTSPRFNMKSKNIHQQTKGNTRLTENTKPDQRADTMNFTSERPLTKESELSTKKFSFQTYDNDSGVHKNGLNTTKLANRTLLKYADQIKRQSSSSKRGSTRANSTAKPSKTDNKSFYNIEPTTKQKSSSQRRQSMNEKPARPSTGNAVRSGAPVKQRKNEDVKKSKTLIAQEKSFSHYDSKALQYESTKDTRDAKDMKTAETFPDLTELNDRNIFEMSAGLTAYYDLLIERGQTETKLLNGLKENFTNVMKEFSKSYNTAKQYSDMKSRYDDEREKAKKEKELLAFQLKVLKKENDRLKNTNKNFMKNGEALLEESFNRTTGKSFIPKEIQEAIKQEKKLSELLNQREKVISFLKAKEDMYILLLEAIGAQGVNVKQIYKEQIQNLKNDLERHETTLETLPNAATSEYRRHKSNGRPPHRIPKTKKADPIEGDEQIITRKSREHSNPERHPVQEKQSPGVIGQHYWERQFTEASNSGSQSIHSMHSSKPSFPEEYSNQIITQSQFDTYNDERDSIPVREVANSRFANNEENSAELKEKLKLDLSAIQQKVIKQYHDEFMEKWAEFTSSWKRALEKDKTFNHINENLINNDQL